MSAPETQAPVAGRNRDAGDTLIEILIAVAILGIVSAALIGGFLTSISTSAVYESVANSDTVLRTAVDSVTTQMQQAPATAFGCSPAWSVASPPSVYVVTGLPTGYTSQVTQVNYWVNGTEQAGCSADAPQLISLTITYSSGTSTATNSATFLVDDPDAPPVQSYGSAYRLVFLSTGGPSNATAGSAIPQQPLVAIEDNSNPPKIVTTDLSPVTLSITSGSGTPGALLANCTGSEFYGVVNFKGCEIDTAGSGYTLTATDSGLPQPTAISRAFTVNPGPATNFLFTSWPVNQGSPPVAGTSQQPFGEQPTVTLRDAYGNTATTTTATIDLAITSGTGASGATLSCTSTSLTTSNGVAAFQGCNIDKAASSYTLTATDGSGSLASAVTQSFNIGPGSPIKLVFTTEPKGSAGSAPGYNGTITGGSAFPTQPVVTIEDAAGNTVTSNNSAVTLSITSNTGTSGAGLSCTNNTVTASSGVATFSGCYINLSGSGYTLTAQDPSLTSGISAPAFNVSVGPAAQLAFTTEPGGSPLTAGSPFPTQPVVAVEDAGGNTVTTGAGSNAAITVAINSGTGTLTCSNNTVTATGGVAGFGNCSINKTGSFTLKANGDSLPATTSSPAFTVSAGPPAQLAFTTEPGGATAGSAFSSQPVVTVEDAEGNPVPNSPVALTINSGSGTLTCSNNTVATSSSGVASFSNCSINKTGSFTLKATDGSATATSSPAFTVSAGPPAQLAFTAEPSGSNTAGTAFSTQPAVTVEDAEGNLVPNSPVTLSITSGATLTCTSNTVNTNSSGVAAFSGCKATTAGSGYTLTATDGSVNATSSPTFTVAAGSASQLVFTTAGEPPSSIAKGSSHTFSTYVTLEDAYGNTVTGNSSQVTLKITSSGATLTCSSSGNPLALNASTGIAAFSGCYFPSSITKGDYTLTATDGTIVSLPSSTIDVT